MENLSENHRGPNHTQFNDPPGDSLEHLLRELLSLNKELRSIRGSLKVETVKRFSWKKYQEVKV